MLRRFVCCTNVAAALVVYRRLSLSGEARDGLTKPLSSLKEECKGQQLDLADMAEVMKTATNAYTAAVKKADTEDQQLKGKLTTLSASVKVYNTRLANLNNETRAIQGEIDAILKLLWGTENPHGATFASPPAGASASAEPREEFEVEPPPISRILNEEKPGTGAAASADASTATISSTPAPPVEQVDGERVVGSATPGTASPASAAGGDEIEVETIEIDVEPATDDAVDAMKVTDITKELYEKGVNFSDCMDARTLRQRYRDVLSGRIPSSAASPKPPSSTKETLAPNPDQPRMPHRSQAPPQQQQQQQRQSTSESGLATDPYPNAHRKMVDPMKYIYQIKEEVAAEKGIDPRNVDLWSGKVKLDDSKRLYDYPSVQSYPIEVRQKGDIPA